MEKFEIHVTGTVDIIGVLDDMGVKSLHAELMGPDGRTVGVEHMSSFVRGFADYDSCKEWVDGFVAELEGRGVEIHRVKIECPYSYDHYRERSVYIESHFPKAGNCTTHPYVYNVRSDKYVSTDRTYAKSSYDGFISKWERVEHAEIELCLFDDNVRHDAAWVRSFPDASWV